MATIKSHFRQNLCLDYVAKESHTTVDFLHPIKDWGNSKSHIHSIAQSEYQYLTIEFIFA